MQMLQAPSICDAGIIMHKTHTTLLTWFWASFVVAHNKRGVSATYIARELELTYPTAWLLLHKIRKAMGDRDINYKLAGLVELDDAFFGAPTEGGKRGRGTEQNARAHRRIAKQPRSTAVRQDESDSRCERENLGRFQLPGS